MSNSSPVENLSSSYLSSAGNSLVETALKIQETMRPITEAAQRYQEIMRPVTEAAQKYQEILRPIMETAQRYADMLQPLNEAAKKFAEMMQPYTVAAGAINARISDFVAIYAKAARRLIVIEKFRVAQYVYWDFIPGDFVDEVISSDNVNEILLFHESQSEYTKSNTIIEKCRQNPYIAPQKLVFEQTVDAYHNGNYDLAVLGFVAVIDSVLTEASGNYTHRPFDRCKAILNKISEKSSVDSDEYAILMLGLTFQATVDSLFETIRFSEEEPQYLNRNWIMHGRSKIMKSRLDCIKLINFLYGIILIDELS